MKGTLRGSSLFVVALAASVMLVSFAVYRGWTRTASDFPSYYAAAVLLRKREKLPRFYDMPSFQRALDRMDSEHQLGGYIPQTPVTMLPFVPFTELSMRSAKRCWLLVNVLFLGATVWMLWSMTGLSLTVILGLLVAGAGTLYTNFLLGQYYVFLLFLLTAGVFCFGRRRVLTGGFLFGLVCGLKLITAPFFLYFGVKREWRALAGMALGMASLAVIALGLFGWTGTVFYAKHVLPRSMAGETLDPYNPGTGTLVTLLRRSFVSDPELNPAPVLPFPALYFFLHPFFAIAILWTACLAFCRTGLEATSLAGLLIATLWLSPNTASYTFLLLLLPVVLLVRAARGTEAVLVAAGYVLLALPLRPSWSWLFPKVWLLGALFLAAVVRYGTRVKRKTLAWGVAGAALAASVIAAINMREFRRSANQSWDPVAVERGAIYSSNPVSLPGGLLYESIARDGYELRWLAGKQATSFSFGGDAFRPALLYGSDLVQFDLVSHDRTQRMLMQPKTGRTQQDSSWHQHAAEDTEEHTAALSPDGKWMAFSQSSGGTTQVYICALDGKRRIQVTRGRCNSFEPGWEWNSSAVLFASDCGRGLGLPALYRAPLERILGSVEKK